jgi:hypothetical protein
VPLRRGCSRTQSRSRPSRSAGTDSPAASSISVTICPSTRTRLRASASASARTRPASNPAGTVAVIALGVIDQGEINRQSLTGAVCIYLLLGFMFMFVYGAIAAFDSDPFFAQGGDGTPSIRLYFSYVTLATLGYGDYTAAESLGRSVSVVEALCGQLYLVTVVALMVGHYGQRRPR